MLDIYKNVGMDQPVGIASVNAFADVVLDIPETLLPSEGYERSYGLIRLEVNKDTNEIKATAVYDMDLNDKTLIINKLINMLICLNATYKR